MNLNKCIFLDGARVFVRNLTIADPLEYDINHDFPFIKVHFVLKGKCHYEPQSERGVPVTVEEGQYNFFYLPEVHGKLQVSPSSVVSTIDIECDEAFVKRLFKHDFFKISGAFGESVKARLPFKLNRESQQIPPVLKNKVDEILSYAQNTGTDTIYLETLLKTIFHYLFTELTSTAPVKQLTPLKNKERERVLQAEQILREHIHDTITVAELAAAIGTNRHKLNRDFKRVYNETIFSYVTQLRMNEAKLMLTHKNMNVSEVADRVGYKNPQHFTAAFKKHFGYVPSKL